MGLEVAARRRLLSGNAAIARGAYEAGVAFAAGYPGTPSTEILENIASYPEIDCQWAANEKVAFDEAMGVAIAGKRALVAMKHVGLNVAADSFMVFPYSGTVGGFVVITADDPGMHSSQNEQDNRYFAKFAKVPLLEPADAQEAKDFVVAAFELSEAFQTPVLLRTTMRLSHTKCVVEVGERKEPPPREFNRVIPDWVVPVFSRRLRPRLDARLERLAEFAESFPCHREEPGDGEIGVLTSGVSYHYAREALPGAGFLKLAMTYPLPRRKVLDFCRRYRTVYVVEETEPFLEEQVRLLGVTNVVGKDRFPSTGELSPEAVEKAVRGTAPPGELSGEIAIPPRPPMLCAGCPHRGVFYALNRLKLLVAGDIGCYTLGCLPPLSAVHTTFCMGAGIGNALGFGKAGIREAVAVIGDSTFIHAGIPALIDVVYNQGSTTVVILDNRTTGMTGHQQHPGTGRTLRGEPTHRLDLLGLVRAVGVEFVREVDPYDLKATRQAIKEAVEHPGPAVVITSRPCVLIPEEKVKVRQPYRVLDEKCNGCGICYRLGCPAVLQGQVAVIDRFSCTGCSLCEQVCPHQAIVPAEEESKT